MAVLTFYRFEGSEAVNARENVTLARTDLESEIVDAGGLP